MARNRQCTAIETRVWLRASQQDLEQLTDAWVSDEVAYRKMVLELGRVYG